MAEDLFAGGVAFLDEVVDLYVEADQAFAPAVTVTFEATHQGSSPTPTTLTFTEKLTARPSALRDPKRAKGKVATRIQWTVNINSNPAFRDTTVLFKFVVTGKSTTGVNMVAPTQDHIVIGAIRVTKDPTLTRIMVHEFAKPSGNTFAFDPAPLEAYVKSLTVQQKQLLFRHAIAKPAGRLVVLVTIYPRKDLRMFADYCERDRTTKVPLPRKCVRPNATFSVFHCFDPLKGGVTLVCHTEHFLVNLNNSLGLTKTVTDPATKAKTVVPRKDPRDTWLWIHGRQGGKQPDDWLAKSNPAPVQFKIASEFPQRDGVNRTDGNDGVIWSRIFTPAGRDIMLGNTMHGMINTVGCWMLFRNYNWPAPIANDLDRINRRKWRERLRENMSAAATAALAKGVEDALAAVGYDARVATATDSSSMDKFFTYDENFAYLWFFHDVVGIEYFSATTSGENAVNIKTAIDAHGATIQKTFPLAQAGRPPTTNLPEEGTFAYHNLDDRHAADPTFKPSDALWRTNAMGFKAASGFIPLGFESSDLSAAVLGRVAWADVYFYREDSVHVAQLTTRNYSEADPNV